MSNTKLQIAIRFNQGAVTGGQEFLDDLEKMLDKKVEYSEFEDNILKSVGFDYAEKEFSASIIDDNLYIDYVLVNETDSFDFDFDISKKKIKKIVNLAQNLGFDTSSYKIKILQYDNGGCAGLSEVE